MIEWLAAAALASQTGPSERHDHGNPFFRLSIQRYLPGREIIFEGYQAGKDGNGTLLIERRIEELGGESRHDVTVRECGNIEGAVEAMTRIRVPNLYIEGVSQAPEPESFNMGTVYEFRGFVRHPNGEMGEISLSSNDPGGTPRDPLRQWADDLALVFEACLEQ